MTISEKITAAVTAAKNKVKAAFSAEPTRYSQQDVVEAGVVRPYKSAKEKRDIEAIREDLKRKAKIKDTIEQHKKSLGLK